MLRDALRAPQHEASFIFETPSRLLSMRPPLLRLVRWFFLDVTLVGRKFDTNGPKLPLTLRRREAPSRRVEEARSAVSKGEEARSAVSKGEEARSAVSKGEEARISCIAL
jgi:hypothetical protein